MSRFARSSVCLVVLMLGLALDASAGPTESSSESVLVLRNGRVLAGRVLTMGDFYEVSFREHGEVRVRLAEVEMWCASLDEAYLRKRDGLRTGDVAGRFALAEWCLRNGLFHRASDQLLVLSALVPAHPSLVALERRLLSAAVVPPAGKTAASPAGASEDASHTVSTGQLPVGAVLHFTQRIQPMLLNRCASNACHGPRSPQQFQLFRPVRGQPLSNRMTQRNLLATLAFIDQQRPERSQLLMLPRQPHGDPQTPVFGERDTMQYEQLVAWTKMLTTQGPATDGSPSAVVDAGTPGATEGTETGGVAQASYVEVLPAAKAAPSSKDLATPQRLPDASPAAADPLDPEVFNREYLEEEDEQPPPGTLPTP